jgi:hypothetical protein
MLVHMFEKCNLHDLFIPGFPALLESFYIQERLIEKHLPKVSKHMVIDSNNIGRARAGDLLIASIW